MASPLGPAFAGLLHSRRSRYNALFAEARRARPALDPNEFSDHLANVVAPLVERAASVAPERAGTVADALYDLSLELVGRDLLGPRSRYPALQDGWTSLLAQLPHRLAEAPRLFAGAVTNALYNLSIVPGARPRDWLRDVARLSACCDTAAELLEAAKVSAWRAGLAHYRQGALAVCRRLRPGVASAALGFPVDQAAPESAVLDNGLERLLADPWLDPLTMLAAPASKQHLHVVARVGAFRGFGGQFMAPPTVSAPGGDFVVSDGLGRWLLTADRFGATLHRIDKAPTHSDSPASPPFVVGRAGEIARGSYRAVFADLEPVLSSASNRTTLAVTTRLSHAVTLIALVPN